MIGYAGVTTLMVALAVCAASRWCSAPQSDAFASVRAPPAALSGPAAHALNAADGAPAAPAASLRAALGANGLLCYGMGFGVLLALGRGVSRQASGNKVARRAADIEVAEKTETKPVAYLENIPRSIMDKTTLDQLLSTVPKEKWEDPPEESYLYVLKMYAETYGEGKSTKMGWWDFWYMRVNMPEAGEFLTGEELEEQYQEFRRQSLTGELPMFLPGPAGFFPASATFKWRGAEPFAGDLVQSVVSDGKFAKDFIGNTAFYREGLKPWQRGLEIGMAHGYFLIGPFVTLGPLRNTPEAATVGLLCGVAVVGIVSVGGLIFGSTIAPPKFDKPGATQGSGFIELVNWHALGGVGGAGFAHALLTIFGS